MKWRNVIALSVLGLLVFVLAFFQTPLMEQARRSAWNWWVNTVAGLRGIESIEQVETPGDQLARLRAENIRLQAELRDYRILREQLAAPSVSDWQVREALVAGRPIEAFHTSFRINRGFSQGLAVGMPVVAEGQYLVGVIEEVGADSAVVRTLLHPNSQFSVATVPADTEAKAARGLLESRFQTSLHMVTVPRDIPVQVGETVVTDSRNEKLPLGLVVGTVREIDAPEHEAYQELRLEMPYDLDELRGVTVLVTP